MTLIIILGVAALVGAIYLILKAQAHKKSLTASNLVEEVKTVQTQIKAEPQPVKAKAPKKVKQTEEKPTQKKVIKNK